MTHYAVNSKVFLTEKEARDFSMWLMSMGGLGGWRETSDAVTHIYLGHGITEPIKKTGGVIYGS